MSYRIFCDMDGVLVNLYKGLNERLLSRYIDLVNVVGHNISENPFLFEDKLISYYVSSGIPEGRAKFKAAKIVWGLIEGDVSFWRNLEWMSDGEELFKYCYGLRSSGLISELNILSSPSHDPICIPGKESWLKRVGIYERFDRVIFLKEKYKECVSSNDILIDDTDVQINGNLDFSGWRGVGGTGILHTSTVKTVDELKLILDKS